MKMSPQGVMSSEKASNSPGLFPVEGQKPSLGTQTKYCSLFSSLSLGITKTTKRNLDMPCTNDDLVYKCLSAVAQIDHQGMINGCEACEMFQVGNFFGRNF
jgi:hypothetical protein